MLAVIRSLADPRALGDWLATAYGLVVVDCVLLRSLVNDVYRVDTTDASYALKLYRHGRWSLDEIAWEIDLVDTLIDRGMPVPGVIPSVDGAKMTVVPTPEGSRAAVLSDYIAHDKPQPPFEAGLYREFGELTARFHRAAANVSDRHRRPFANVNRVLVEPLRQVLPLLAHRPTERDYIAELGKRAADEIGCLSDSLTTGVCHADITLDNVWRGSAGLMLHDFDSAGYGWLAQDLTGVAGTTHLDAFLDGYRRHADLTAADENALPWLGVAATVANLRFHLVDKPRFAGVGESVWIESELAALRERSAALDVGEGRHVGGS